MNTNRRYSVREAADRLGVSYRTIYRMIHDREIPSVKIRGRYWIPAESFDRWHEKYIELRTVEPQL